jgi:E3 ubiquitin-protein ligase RNF5
VMTGFLNPMLGMFNEMVFTRNFGTLITNMFARPYTNPLMGSNSPRMRRQEMQLDKSLNRVSIFFLCCIILCLLLF